MKRQIPPIIGFAVPLVLSFVQMALAANGVAVNSALAALWWLAIAGLLTYTAVRVTTSTKKRWGAFLLIAAGCFSAWFFIRAPVANPITIDRYVLTPLVVGQPADVALETTIAPPGARLRIRRLAIIAQAPDETDEREWDRFAEAKWNERASELADSAPCPPGNCAVKAAPGRQGFASDTHERGRVLITQEMVNDYGSRRAAVLFLATMRYGPGAKDVYEVCVFFTRDRTTANFCHDHNGIPE